MSKLNSQINSQGMDDYLPRRLPCTLRREVERLTDFRGMATPFGGGAMADGVNLSPRKSPALATRLPRGILISDIGSGTPHGMARFGDSLYFIRGTVLYTTADGTTVHAVGTVSDTDKSFFVFGDRLYIYPDKLCVERGSPLPRSVELDTGVIEQAEFNGTTVTLPRAYSWSDLGFEVGDCLRVRNEDDATPAPEGDYRIVAIRNQTVTVAGGFPAVYTSKARFLRAVPPLERCCVCGDRVYGILGREVYVSGAGSATDFYSRPVGDGKHPVILRSDTDGDFTALTSWQGYTVFFKSDRICKLLGGRSDSFTLHDAPAVGIPAAMADTLCEVGDALYYASDSGVYRYRGQEPERISGWNGVTVESGCGGSDGVAYYLAVKTPAGHRLSLYLPDQGVWYPEDALDARSMLRQNGFLLLQSADGRIRKTASDGRAAGCRFDERQDGGLLTARVTLPADHRGEPYGYRLTGLFIRATGAAGGCLRVLARIAPRGGDLGEEDLLLGQFEGGVTDRLLCLSPLPRPCDGMTLTLEATGDWVIHSLAREYELMGQ